MGQKYNIHGLSQTRLYQIYNNMKYRCCKPYAKEYENYGGRGITVCDEWIDNFQNFYNWAITNGYSDELTIDRIDNDKGYSPNNCRWATNSEQKNNTSRNRNLEFNGETHNITEWAKITGINECTIRKRLRNGWSIEDALTKAIDIKRRNLKYKENDSQVE